MAKLIGAVVQVFAASAPQRYFIITPFTHAGVNVFLSSAQTGDEWSDLLSGRFLHGERFLLFVG
jgi:hypothetical protein